MIKARFIILQIINVKRMNFCIGTNFFRIHTKSTIQLLFTFAVLKTITT